MRSFNLGDIVRFKHGKGKDGIHEITSLNVPEGYDDIDCTVTNDECNSEYYANQENLILICSFKDRKDI